MSDDAELDHAWTKRHDALYKAELSALYHQKRERFFELLDKLGKAAAVFGGSAALWKLGDLMLSQRSPHSLRPAQHFPSCSHFPSARSGMPNWRAASETSSLTFRARAISA
jgi:hypothetical protein